jgi:hypothetical protein
MSDFKELVLERAMQVLSIREGACGSCHAVAEEICNAGGAIVAFERPDGILSRIIDDKGNTVGEGFGIVWSPSILDAQLNAGLIPSKLAEDLRRDGTSLPDDIKRVAELYGYGRVVTPAVLALTMINEMEGRTLIKRVGLGVVATFVDSSGAVISSSPPTYCPTCAVAVGAARTPLIAEPIKESLADKPNTGEKKHEMGIENRYEVKDGHVRVSLLKDGSVLANRTLGCCMAYATVKAEIAAGLVPSASAEQFKLYCNLCPFKHCWMDKSMGATGNIILHRLCEIGAEVEITAKGGIVARIAGQEVEGRGTLCSLSALTNMLLRGDAQKILKPSSAKR